MEIRELEKKTKYGYLFFISYSGKKFDSFDENPGKKSVKGEFIKRMGEIGITWAKGIQQAGRTDAGVSAEGNILYFSTLFNGDMEKVRNEFNKYGNELFIKKILKTVDGIILPEIIEERVYEYRYKLGKGDFTVSEIENRCAEVSGTYDVSKFTDAKGQMLKEKVRRVKAEYDGRKFIFTGDSFMPKQIRIMTSYIVKGTLKPFPAGPLTLREVKLKKEAENLIFKNYAGDISPFGGCIEKIETVDDITVLYVRNENRGVVIGKNGINIKKIRNEFGKVVVRDV